jgi:hypothetical protein
MHGFLKKASTILVLGEFGEFGVEALDIILEVTKVCLKATELGHNLVKGAVCTTKAGFGGFDILVVHNPISIALKGILDFFFAHIDPLLGIVDFLYHPRKTLGLLGHLVEVKGLIMEGFRVWVFHSPHSIHALNKIASAFFFICC